MKCAERKIISILLVVMGVTCYGQKFEEQLIDGQVAIGYGLAMGDVDGDGQTDILLADKKQFVWYRNGDWKRFIMIENLTESDNVCIAARDIDGDGKVEVAVGAQWNPGETTDTLKSGSVHYLIRPKDPIQLWKSVELHHEPTIHRMKWMKVSANQYQLIVVPLHGRGNKNGEGKGVRIFAYAMPKDPTQKWKLTLIDESMHLTHNLELVPAGNHEALYIGGKEGIKKFNYEKGKWSAAETVIAGESFGEIRKGEKMMAGIQPMHGNFVTVYNGPGFQQKTILESNLNQGHALAVARLKSSGEEQIVLGWREPDNEKKTGIKIFTLTGNTWTSEWVDENGMATEDLQVVDLNGDGRKDIIAAGRSSHNLKIYWNKGD